MFPALARYDECERGMVEHACRMVVQSSRYNTYIYPATHFAAPSGNTNVNLPAMGQRLRLKAVLCDPDQLDEGGKGRAAGAEKIRRNGGGQREFLLHLRHAGRPLAGELFQPFHRHRHHELRGHSDDGAE